MDKSRFSAILEAYGADPSRWPAAERDAALHLAASEPELLLAQRSAQSFDRLLDLAPAGHVSDELKRKLFEAAPMPALRPLAPQRQPRMRTRNWLPAFGGVLALRPAMILMFVVMLGVGAGALMPTFETSPDEVNMLSDIWGTPAFNQTGGEW